MKFERSKGCNYSPHFFLPILFGVCAGIILTGMWVLTKCFRPHALLRHRRLAGVRGYIFLCERDARWQQFAPLSCYEVCVAAGMPSRTTSSRAASQSMSQGFAEATAFKFMPHPSVFVESVSSSSNYRGWGSGLPPGAQKLQTNALGSQRACELGLFPLRLCTNKNRQDGEGEAFVVDLPIVTR